MNALPRFVQRHRKVTTWLLVAALATFALVTDSAWPVHHPLHETAEKLAPVLLMFGVLLRLISIAFVGGRKSGQVVDVGPYSLVRNPLYAGSLLIIAAVGLSFGSLLLAALFCLAAWLLFSCLVLAEEEYLQGRLDGIYADYAARTPRWVPRSLRCAAPSTWEVDVRAASLALREAVAFVSLMPAAEAIEWAHGFGALPVLWRLY